MNFFPEKSLNPWNLLSKGENLNLLSFGLHFFKDLGDTKVHLTGKAKLWNFLYQLSAILLAHFHCYLKIGINKTGLQPVSRPVEQVHYFEGWGVGAK